MLNESQVSDFGFGLVTVGLVTKLEAPASSLTGSILDQGIDETEQSAPFSQSDGESPAAGLIKSRMKKVLADTGNAGPRESCRLGIASPPRFGASSMDPWAAKNEQRLRLLAKKYAQGLSLREASELDRLKREVYNHLQSLDPNAKVSLEHIDARIERLRAKQERERGPGSQGPPTEDEFKRRLLAEGRMTSLPVPLDPATYRPFQPVMIEGEPLSETIIRERR